MHPRTARPVTLFVLGLVLLLALIQLSAPVPIIRAAPRDPAITPLPAGFSVDGSVYGLTLAGDTLYVSGDFSYLGERNNGLTVLDADGRIPPGAPRGAESPYFAPLFGRILPDGAGGWFTILASAWMSSGSMVARLDADMRPLPGWPVTANGSVRDVALHGGVLYVAGNFTAISGEPRAGLAALNAGSGALLPWTAAGASGDYWRIAASDSAIYAARFLDASLAAFARDTGAAQVWSPAIAGSSIERLLVDGGRIYVVGQVTSSGSDGVSGNADDAQGLVVLDAVSGAAVGPPLQTSTATNYANLVLDIALSADRIYLAGTFGGVNGQPRRGLAALDRASGTLLPWRADLEYYFGAQPVPNANAIALDGDVLYVGGAFEQAGGQRRRNLVALDAVTGAVLPWRGSVNRSVYGVAAAGGRVALGGIFTLAGGEPSADVAAIDLATGRPRAWEARHTSAVSQTDADFGRGNGSVAGVAPLGDQVFFNTYLQDRFQNVALHRETAALQLWSALPAQRVVHAAAGDILLVSQRNVNTNATLAAFTPFADTPRWERQVAIQQVYKVLPAGDVVYGAGYTYNTTSRTYTGSVFALRLVDGVLLWERPIAGSPSTLALAGDTLFLGGSIQAVGGQAAGNLVALDALSGDTLPWPAMVTPSQVVYDLAIGEGRLYISGAFSAIGGAARPGLAAIDLGPTPALAAWAPQLPAGSPPPLFLALTGDALYAGSSFSAGTNRGFYGLLTYPLIGEAPTPTPTASSTATASPTNTSTATATSTASSTATANTSTATATPTASSTATASPTDTSSATASSTVTGSPTNTSIATSTRTPVTAASSTPTITAMLTASPTRTATPDTYHVYLPLLRYR
jgi:hypothetical protein